MAAVRPEFRADVLVFDPARPGVRRRCLPRSRSAAGRPGRVGMCHGHHQRWAQAGRPDPAAFAASDAARAVARACAAGRLHGAGLRVRVSARAALPAAPARMAAGRGTGHQRLAGGPAAAAVPGRAGSLPGQLLPAVGAPRGRLVLLPPPALEAARPPGPGGVRRRLRPAPRRPGTGGPDRAARPAAAGSPVRPAVPARRQHGQDQAEHRPAMVRLARRQRGSLAARPQRAGLAGRLPGPGRQGRHPVALLIYAHRKVTTSPRAGLGQRVPPRHLAHAPPGHRLPVRDPAVRRNQPAVAQGPGQAVDEVAAEHRPGGADLLPRRPGAHPALGVPRRRGRHRRRRHQPGRARALPRRPGRGHGRAERAPRPHRPGRHVPARRPPPPVGRPRCPRPR